MVKYRWELDEIENVHIVTRVVDSGEEDEAQQPILRTRRVARDNAFDGINEIRASLDMLEKELKNSQEPETETKKPK